MGGGERAGQLWGELHAAGGGGPRGASRPLDGATFHGWVSEGLCPTLQPGDMVLWENLSAHKVAEVEELRTARGTRLRRLSPYSPDFNPIAHCWSKSKAGRRRAKARTVATLMEAIKYALDTVIEADIRGWFAHCGYSVH